MKTLSLVCLNAGIAIITTSTSPPGYRDINRLSPVVTSTNISATGALILSGRVREARGYSEENHFSTRYCFLIDMSIPSGKKRFFVYDFAVNRIISTGLVAHGSGGVNYSAEPKFSNDPGSACTSLGKYKVGELYRGQYGRSYKLYGLESTNCNAYRRAVVLHGYSCVPDDEIFPKGVCNSSGCAMVSQNFFNTLATLIDESQKPILLWIYN